MSIKTTQYPQIKWIDKRYIHLISLILLLLLSGIHFKFQDNDLFDLQDDGTIVDEEIVKILNDSYGNLYIIFLSQADVNSLSSNQGGGDIKIIKMNNNHQIIWNLIIGGKDKELFFDAVIDENNDLIIAGDTYSTDFLNKKNELNGTSDIFLVKIDKNSTVVWFKLFGGSGLYFNDELDYEMINSLSIGSNNSLFLTGETYNIIFMDYDATELFNRTRPKNNFYMRFSSDGNMIWSRYEASTWNERNYASSFYNHKFISVGCADAEFYSNYNIERDAEYIFDLELSLEIKDITITIIDENSKLLSKKFIGGSAFDCATSVTIDSNGAIIISGATRSNDIELINSYDESYNGGYNDIFVMKLNPDLSINWSTYFGGAKIEGMNRDFANVQIGVDNNNNVYISGSTYSYDIPITDNSKYSAGFDIIIAKFSSLGNLLWSTIVGGHKIDIINSLLIQTDMIYSVGYTQSSDINLIDPIDTRFTGYRDSIIISLDLDGKISLISYL